MARVPGLLVSVRSGAEAVAALEGGADIIDVKEPARGALGRADDSTIGAVVRRVNRRRPVSAALGEWASSLVIPKEKLDYVKWGLAGWCDRPEWRRDLSRFLAGTSCPRPVIVAYADCDRAAAPPLDDVVDFVCRQRGVGFLIDTHDKGSGNDKRPTLVDWLSVNAIMQICRRCRDAGIQIALAGSLGKEQIRRLHGARPDWFAVRGAACDGGERNAFVCADRVRELAALL